MKIELHQRRGVHAAREKRHVDEPVIERRSVEIGRWQDHSGAAAGKLKGLLHGRSVANG